MHWNVKETILTITLGLMMVFALAARVWELTPLSWILFVAIGVGLAGITWPWLSRQIHNGWFRLTNLIGFVISRIILSVAFLLLVIPFGLLARLFRKDLMFMKRPGSSLFIERKHRFSREDFEYPW